VDALRAAFASALEPDRRDPGKASEPAGRAGGVQEIAGDRVESAAGHGRAQTRGSGDREVKGTLCGYPRSLPVKTLGVIGKQGGFGQ